MVTIVRAFPVPIEGLAHLNRLPSVDELRPSSCPVCDEPSRPAGEGLRIVGHGTYRRQVLGLACGDLVVWIRRFLCRGCRRTISVLPDALYPGRWYAAAAIALSLFLSLVHGEPASRLRARFGRLGEARGWKTLERWQRQLLHPLWSWWNKQLGAVRPARGRGERTRWLLRFLRHHDTTEDSVSDEIAEAARRSVRETAHAGAVGWDIHRGRPAGLEIRGPRKAR